MRRFPRRAIMRCAVNTWRQHDQHFRLTARAVPSCIRSCTPRNSPSFSCTIDPVGARRNYGIRASERARTRARKFSDLANEGCDNIQSTQTTCSTFGVGIYSGAFVALRNIYIGRHARADFLHGFLRRPGEKCAGRSTCKCNRVPRKEDRPLTRD